jgi:hypothetical protein
MTSTSDFDVEPLPNGRMIVRCLSHDTREACDSAADVDRLIQIHCQFFHRQLDLATGEWHTIVPRSEHE